MLLVRLILFKPNNKTEIEQKIKTGFRFILMFFSNGWCHNTTPIVTYYINLFHWALFVIVIATKKLMLLLWQTQERLS